MAGEIAKPFVSAKVSQQEVHSSALLKQAAFWIWKVNAVSAQFRFDFPPDVVAAREAVFQQMRSLLSENTLSAIREASRLQLDWLQRYPDDYVMMDAGEVLSMSEGAILATEPQPDFNLPDLASEQL